MSELKTETKDSFQTAVNVVGQILNNELEANRISTLMSYYQELCETNGHVVWPEQNEVTSGDVEEAIDYLDNNNYDDLCSYIKSYQGLYIPEIKN